jgi:serine/threonine protein kinase
MIRRRGAKARGAMDPLIGRSLGPYDLVGRLGAGGMGTVYRAVHRLLDQPRALKVLPAHLAADETFVERFQREARTAARLRHPHIVMIYDVGEHDGAYYIAMELVEGRSLRQVLRAEGPLGLPRATRLLRQLAEALDFAHSSGVVHRDVKPANILVRDDDHVVLADFGIARAGEAAQLTRTGLLVGTIEYLAPEAVLGAGGGPSADLYALGVVAYEILVGRSPFSGLDTPALLYAQLHTAPPPPRQFLVGLPAAVEATLLRQLAKNPAERYPTGTNFVRALAAAVGPMPVDSRDAPTPPRGVPILAEPAPPEQPRRLAATPPPRTPPPMPAAGRRGTPAPAGRSRPPPRSAGLSGGVAALLVGAALGCGLLAVGMLWWFAGIPRLESLSAILATPEPAEAAAEITPEPTPPADPTAVPEEPLIARQTSVVPVPTATIPATALAAEVTRPLASPSPVPGVAPLPPPSPPPVASPAPAAPPSTGIEIRVPADGARVPEQVTVEGRMGRLLPPGSHLWLVVRPLVEGGRWYPSHGEISVGPDGAWTTEIYLGGPAEVGHEIRVGVVDAATHAELVRHLAERRDEPLSAWTPPDDWGEARVTVTRQ